MDEIFAIGDRPPSSATAIVGTCQDRWTPRRRDHLADGGRAGRSGSGLPLPARPRARRGFGAVGEKSPVPASDVSFEVRAGETSVSAARARAGPVGGAAGAVRREPAGPGHVELGGKALHPKNPRETIRQGAAYVLAIAARRRGIRAPDPRKRHADPLPRERMVLANLPRWRRRYWPPCRR